MCFTMENEEVADLLEKTAAEIRRVDKIQEIQPTDLSTLQIMIANVCIEMEAVTRRTTDIDIDALAHSFM